jgi:hypothetical protein
MKKAIAVLFVVLLSTSAIGAVKCQPDGRGGTCCWDTDRDGPWKPISC